MMSENRQIGTGLLALGGIFLFLGMLLFFDAGLLAIGETSITRQTTHISHTSHFVNTNLRSNVLSDSE